jgi:flagellar biosynthesis activator protein FlaF
MSGHDAEPMPVAEAPPPGYGHATRAYAASSSRRSVREQEAAIFRYANVALRRGEETGGAALVRALADIVRLWNAVLDLVSDPDNALPAELRAQIISVGMAVQREIQSPTPDIGFLLSVNENMAAGLTMSS